MNLPHLVFITCDQLRKDTLGCYGDPVIQTPNIDRLAAMGVRFENSFTACPVCAPNRAALATGRYPSINGVKKNGCILPESEMTMMEALRQRGYRTRGVGKMHFGPQWRYQPGQVSEIVADRERHGAVDPQPQPWEFPWYGFEDGSFIEDSHVGPYAKWAQAQGAEPFKDPHSWSYPQSDTTPSAVPEELHHTTWIGNESVRFIDAHDPAEAPLFLWTSFVHPHHPFNAPAPYDTMYAPQDMPEPIWDEELPERWPESIRHKHENKGSGHEQIGMSTMSREEWAHIKAVYYGMITLIDKQVGRMLDALEQRGMLENTVFIFTSDHGELLGDYKLLFKGVHYDVVTNVPLIVAGPGIGHAGETRDTLCCSTDVAPTALACAGVDQPLAMQGQPLTEAIEDPDQKLYEQVLIEDTKLHRRSLRTPSARLTWHGHGERGELYDLNEDPQCLRNLWDSPEAATLQSDMLGRLMDALTANVDPVPPASSIC